MSRNTTASPVPTWSRGDDGPACVVCGCTQNRACEEGCCWAIGWPPVCSSCVTTYLLAEQWLLIERAPGPRSAELERLHRELARGGYVPTFAKLGVIQRRIKKCEGMQS